MSAPILFDDFKPGARMGETSLVYGAELAGQWERIFGASSEAADQAADLAAKGASIATVMMMRAYMSIVSPRPPGNVHARQHLVLDDVPVRHERVRVEISCVGKELRRGRRYVDLEVVGTGEGGRPLYRGLMNLIWAA
ncbi:MAG: hypothetical protein IKE60_23450 [Reyranella sp.]|mgnify:FL=1|uniref:hypothetical protein n=1 Tax=Reyranella sp. TaxID=1929291 RepID=UPI000AE28C03|nr:hypothetical protein [Reyranella sp.]MBR2817637.1 hypothetical protein [Reyranella sp.]